jgi:hypothetical protein
MNIQSERGTRVLLKLLASWGIPLGLLTIFAVPGMANHIDTAQVTQLTCTSFTIQLSASELNPGQTYEIDWTISGTFSCPPFSSTTAFGPITFVADSTGTFNTTVTENYPNIFCDAQTYSGTASLVQNGSILNTISITFPNGQTSDTINCSSPTPTPTPTPCPPCAESCIQSNFNGTAIGAGDTIWFNAHIKASGIPSSGATISFCGSTVTSSAFSAAVPNGKIVFSPSATCATTTFDSSSNTWTTTVPISGSDEIFLTGLALPVPSGLPGGGISPVWCGIFSASVPGISVQWQWGAAVYTCFPPVPGGYNSLNIKPTHQNACNVNNGDHAGTPESKAIQNCVTGGAGGGGGSNFTGSWSGTVSTQPCVQ